MKLPRIRSISTEDIDYYNKLEKKLKEDILQEKKFYAALFTLGFSNEDKEAICDIRQELFHYPYMCKNLCRKLWKQSGLRNVKRYISRVFIEDIKTRNFLNKTKVEWDHLHPSITEIIRKVDADIIKEAEKAKEARSLAIRKSTNDIAANQRTN